MWDAIVVAYIVVGVVVGFWTCKLGLDCRGRWSPGIVAAALFAGSLWILVVPSVWWMEQRRLSR